RSSDLVAGKGGLFERLQISPEILGRRRRLDAQYTRERGGGYNRRICPELFLQFLAGSHTNETNLNVITRAQSRHFDQSSSQRGYLDWIPHVKHVNLTIEAARGGLKLQLHRLRDGHEIMGHLGICDRHRTA